MQAYAIALAAVCVISLVLRDGRVTLTAVALLLNWLVCSMAVMALDNNVPWWLFMAVDASTLILLAIISIPNVTKPQMAVLFSYIFEVIVHTTYGVLPYHFAYEQAYYNTLSWTAWAQLAIVAAWGIADAIAMAGIDPFSWTRPRRNAVLRRDVGVGSVQSTED